MISPLLDLEDERRKRQQALMSKIGDLSFSLADAPLTYQSLMHEQEDRTRKIAKDREDMQFKRDEERRAQESHDQNMEEGKGQIEQGKENLEKTKFDLKSGQTKMDDAEKSKTIHDMVASKIAEKPDADEAAILGDAINDPDWKELPNPDALEAEIASQMEAKRKTGFDEGLKTKNMDIRQQDANTRATRAQQRGKSAVARLKTPNPKLFPPQTLTTLSDLQTKIQNLGEVQRYKDQNNIDTGPLAGTITKLRQLSHTMSPQQAVMNSEAQTVLSEELHRLSGATVTPQEYSRLAQMLPSKWDDEDVYEALTDLGMDMASREYNNLYDHFSQAGYSAGGLKKVTKEGQKESPVGDVSGITKQVISEHPDWSRQQLKAEIKARLSK